MSFTVALDDFGASHSSLTLLKYFDIDTLKIDREFISDLSAAGDGKPIAEALVTLVKNLRLRPIAEGVEQASEVEALRKMGCAVAQGYYFAAPMPVAEFEEFMRGQAELKQGRG